MFRVEFAFSNLLKLTSSQNQKNSMTDNLSERNKSCLNKLQKKGHYNKTNQNNKIL